MGKLAESRTEGAANLEIWKSARADAWLAYHNGIFATSHYEGALTSEDISSVATAALKGHKIRGGNVNKAYWMPVTDWHIRLRCRARRR